jgi:hypothetical protein
VGWFSENRWRNGSADAIHEINLSAEHLKDDDVGDTILHELAHAENKRLGIHDCSGASRQMHNKHFKRMAERLGLHVKRDKRVGYGVTELGQTAAAFLDRIVFKHQLFAVVRLPGVSRSKPGSRLVKLECPGCDYVIRTTQRWINEGLPTCHCGKGFAVA